MPQARFHAIVFDLDGTLTHPTLDFGAIREEIGILSGDLVTEIAKREPAEQERAWRIIRVHEHAAMKQQRLQDGAGDLLARCRRDGVRTGVVTRNERSSVDHLCRTFGLVFDGVIARDFRHVKPHPGPVLHLLQAWGLAPDQALVVGDYLHDIASGRAAGARTCFFQNPGLPFYGADADYSVNSMHELARIVWPTGG